MKNGKCSISHRFTFRTQIIKGGELGKKLRKFSRHEKPALEFLLIFLLCFNVQKALSNSTSCPADTYPDIYRGGRRDINHCTTFVLSKELKTTKNMPETKGDNTLLGKM
ncbi:hypothetical protein T08_1846, partial [Trichinella sp. T8]